MRRMLDNHDKTSHNNINSMHNIMLLMVCVILCVSSFITIVCVMNRDGIN